MSDGMLPLVASERAMALRHAAARRQLWRKHHEMRLTELLYAYRIYCFLVTDYGKRYRPENIQRVDRWYLRLICTELRRRGVLVLL